MAKITERIRGVAVSPIDGLSTMVYILRCEGGLILIDVGFTPLCIASIEGELHDISEKWDSIKLILITHAHGDHIENLQKVLELTGHPEVMLGTGDMEALKEQTGVEADMGLEQGDLISACGGIEIISVPGHSEGNLTYYLQEEKAMIVGDTIFGDDNGNLSTPPAKYSNDAEMAKRGIRKLLGYDFDKLLLAHGKNILRNAKEEVEKLVNV
jgi:glyoxylase-like metal-dependent hydrolase (beta-lactamase superfamily II)